MLQKNGKYICGETDMYLPNLLFDSEMYFPEDKIKLIYTPGHTIDSISVIDEEDNIINVGDNIGDDLDNIIPNLYCEKELYKDTLLKYLKMDFDTIISGHNVILEKTVIDRIINML